MSSDSVIRRRNVLVGAAWSAPVIALATAAPALAASAPQLVFRFASVNYHTVGTAGTMLFVLGNTGSVAYPAGATFEASMSQSNAQAISRSVTLNNRTSGFSVTQVQPPEHPYQSYWRFTLTQPVPPATGNFPLTNPTFALDFGAGSSHLHMTAGHITASSGTTAAQGLPVGSWFDSSGTASSVVVGWWRPANGSTYPNSMTRVYEDL